MISLWRQILHNIFSWNDVHLADLLFSYILISELIPVSSSSSKTSIIKPRKTKILKSWKNKTLIPIFLSNQFSMSKKVFVRLRVQIKLRCEGCFTHAYTACHCVFNEITLGGSYQGHYFENATACSKRTLKTTVATQL